MYGALWRLMPGPLWLRITLLVLLFAAVLAALVLFVCPGLNTFGTVTDVPVGT